MKRITEGGKEEKYLENEKVYFGLEIKARKIFGEEIEESIWRRKIFSTEEKENESGKGGNYLEKENIFGHEKENQEGKGGKYLDRKTMSYR